MTSDDLTCMYFTGGGIQLLVSDEAEETAHEGTGPTIGLETDILFMTDNQITTVLIGSFFSNGSSSSQVSDGFIAHFYAVCEQISPVLAWGFLGPKSSLHDFCCSFKVGPIDALSTLLSIGSSLVLLSALSSVILVPP